MEQFTGCFSERVSWSVVDGVAVWGWPFRDGDVVSGRSLAACFQDVDTVDGFRSVVDSLNGPFAVVVETDTSAFVAVDRWQSLPLFYAETADGVHVGDDPARLREAVDDDDVDELAVAEYVRSTFVTGSRTLAPSVSQLQAGELLAVTETAEGFQGRTDRYYRFADRETVDFDEPRLLDAYDRVLEDVFDRLVDYADGRPIALSLSSGHDSRLVALELVERDSLDLYAFSYSRNQEEKSARRIADDLDIPFSEIVITREAVASWYDSAGRERFDEYAGIEGRVPNYWLPVVMQKLKSETDVPDDAVVVTGDGAHGMSSAVPVEWTDRESITRAEFLDAVFELSYACMNVDEHLKQAVRDQALAALETDLYAGTDAEPADRAIPAFEEWNWQERQVKAITSGYVYRYYGYDCWFPLKDDAYMDFWRDAPLEHRVQKAFHKQYVERRYQEVTGVSRPAATFEVLPTWLWYLNRSVGELPVVGSAGRRIYNHLFASDTNYKPIFGVLGEDEYRDLLGELDVEPTEGNPFTPRHLHALSLLGKTTATERVTEEAE